MKRDAGETEPTGRPSRRQRAGYALLFAAAALAANGCSFLFLSRPQEYYEPQEPITCTTSDALPVVDTVFAVLHILSIAYLSSRPDSAFTNKDQRANLISADVSGLFLYGVSAGWGYYKVSQCNDILARDVARPWRPTARRVPRRPSLPSAPTATSPTTRPIGPLASPADNAAAVPQQIDPEEEPAAGPRRRRARPAAVPDAVSSPSPRPPGS